MLDLRHKREGFRLAAIRLSTLNRRRSFGGTRVERIKRDVRWKSASLERLAVVFADPLRTKIVTELYLREMSPKQFHEEFGGGSLSRVDRHFKKLAETKWITFKRSETGGRRRSATEHFYRATELVVFDRDRWAELPASLRASFSLMAFEQLTERVSAAIGASTFDARSDRHLSWTSMLLDEQGWERLLAAMVDLFNQILEAQDQARLRIADSGEKSMLVTTGIAAFESGSQSEGPTNLLAKPDPKSRGGIGRARSSADAMLLFPTHLAKVLADPLAMQILAEANRREISPKMFAAEFGGATVAGVSRRSRKLEENGWLRISREESGGERRGAVEHFYRAVGPAPPENKNWPDVPTRMKRTLSWKTFERLRETALDAIATGVFDRQPERHLTWSLLRLDEAGWKEVVAAVETHSELLRAEEQEAKERLTTSDEEPLLATVALLAFESPRPPKVP